MRASLPVHKRLGIYLSYRKNLGSLIVNWINLTYDFDMTVTRPNKKSGYVLPLGLVWISLVFAGFTILEKEEFTPAPHVLAAGLFPSVSSLKLDATRPTLLVFAHPQCPCTEATFQELTRLRSNTGDKLAITIIFPIPVRVAAGWENGELWSEAKQMAGVQVYRDAAGTETRRFGITTSGHVLLYSPAGQLLFSGGITLSRGHDDGTTPGVEAITRLLHGESLTQRETPVFGCTLL
jgi:hypothetical protein